MKPQSRSEKDKVDALSRENQAICDAALSFAPQAIESIRTALLSTGISLSKENAVEIEGVILALFLVSWMRRLDTFLTYVGYFMVLGGEDARKGLSDAEQAAIATSYYEQSKGRE